MAAQGVMAQQDRSQDDTLGDLHLCNNYRHLLISLASIAASGRAATVVYLDDVLPIPADLRARLQQACPQAKFIFTRDADQIAAFARLPATAPAIVRRNLTWGGRFGLQRPQSWQPPILSGQRFDTGYLYHAGFFLSKTAAGLCNRVVLRESGLNNYVALPVPPLKALLRWLSRIPPSEQVWGEERWIDRLEVSHPQDLPAAVRNKATQLTFSDVMDALPATTARQIAGAFLPDLSGLEPHSNSALLLTQPLAEIGICSPAEKLALYDTIATRLIKAGYQLHVKPHPLETPLPLPGAKFLPASFPVEAWPYFSNQKFGLAVALCSASLVKGARMFAEKPLQLLSPEVFNAQDFRHWDGLIEAQLQKAGLH